jgi:hypothetical protein
MFHVEPSPSARLAPTTGGQRADHRRLQERGEQGPPDEASLFHVEHSGPPFAAAAARRRGTDRLASMSIEAARSPGRRAIILRAGNPSLIRVGPLRSNHVPVSLDPKTLATRHVTFASTTPGGSAEPVVDHARPRSESNPSRSGRSGPGVDGSSQATAVPPKVCLHPRRGPRRVWESRVLRSHPGAQRSAGTCMFHVEH